MKKGGQKPPLSTHYDAADQKIDWIPLVFFSASRS